MIEIGVNLKDALSSIFFSMSVAVALWAFFKLIGGGWYK